MKKFLITAFCLLQASVCMATDQVKVIARNEFKTDSPSREISVSVMEPSSLGKYHLEVGTILNCDILKIIDPKRGKRNATFYVKPVSYLYNGETTQINQEMYGRYSKTVLSKEELKKIPPTQLIKKAGLSVGNHFVKGLSIGVAFVEGVVKNEEENRLKSGVEKAYKESPLSYVGQGEQLDIKVGDDFYLVFKTENDVQEPNYSYEEKNNER